LRIVATLVSLVDGLRGAVRELSKKAVSHYGVLTSLFRSIAKTVRKWQNLKDYNIPDEVDYSSEKYRQNNFSPEYMRKHDTVSSIPSQRTLDPCQALGI